MRKIFFTAVIVLIAVRLIAQPNFALVGYATQNGGTTGGAGGTTVTVTNLTDFKQYAESSDKYIIMVSGTIANGTTGAKVSVKSNKSIIGVGSTAFLSGIGLALSNANNIIIQNVKFTFVGLSSPAGVNGGDLLVINGTSKNVWVDHCEFYSEDPDVQTDKDKYDGMLDIRDQTGYITVSWCYFHDHWKCGLVGAADTDLYAERLVTYHHNYYKNIKYRMPMYRGATGHFFNNYLYDVEDASEIRAGTCVRVEKNYYEKFHYAIYTPSDSKGYTERIDNYLSATQSRAFPGNCTASIPYTYSAVLTTTTTDVKSVVTQYAGVGKIASTNKAPTVSITAPATGSSYNAPASITLKATATDADGTIAKIEFYNATTLIGTGTASGTTYSFSWTNVPAGTYSITAKATDNGGATVSTTAITLVVKATPQTLVYNHASTEFWATAANWTPASVPTSIDTAIIRTGEAKVSADIASITKVETNGILRITASLAATDIRLQGGTLKSHTSTPLFTLTSGITAEKASTVWAGSAAASVFEIKGTIKGTGNLTKTNVGVLNISADASAFKGNWTVANGILRVSSANALGACGVIVDTASLDIDIAATTYSLILKKGANLNLDANLTVQAAVFDNINLAAGTYKATDYPAFISGTGSLIVAGTLLSETKSANEVTFTAATGSTYSWFKDAVATATGSTYKATSDGSYFVEATTSAGCKISSAPVEVSVVKTVTQTIDLKQGWNLISINVHPTDSSIAILFKSLDVQEIKTMDVFWRKGQLDAFNGLKTITSGEGYLVNMNVAGMLTVAGMPVQTRFIASPQSANWNLIGCPYQSATPFSQDFNPHCSQNHKIS